MRENGRDTVKREITRAEEGADDRQDMGERRETWGSVRRKEIR